VTKPGLTTFGKRDLRDRNLFAAAPGHVLYARDLSNIDVRGMAALSQDKAMIERLQPGLRLDWHEQVADVVWGDPGRRKDAKMLAHAINYNAGAATVADGAGVTHEEAEQIIATLDERFPDLREFKRRVVADAQAGARITNGWGRALTVSVNRSVTQAPGLSGQGWARDAVMECLIRMIDRGVSGYIVAHVHDEYVFELPEDRAAELVALIAESMTFERDGVPVLSSGTPFAQFWGDLY
jgi:DNA polymerase-1